MSILEFILKGVVHMINNEILTTIYILQIIKKKIKYDKELGFKR